MTDVFAIRGDGTGKARLTHDKAASDPDITPDGASIVYTRKSGRWEECCGYETSSIWIMGADGSSPRPLVDGDHDRDPAVSPDGRSVAFIRATDAGGSRLYRADMLGGDPVPVYEEHDQGALHHQPVWSPDGSRIAFEHASGDGSSHALVVVGADGQESRTISGVSVGEWFSWSPDGTRLALSVDRADAIHIDLLDLGTGALTTVHTGGWHPVWLSGSRIAFISESGPKFWDGKLALMDLTTRATKVLPGGPHVRGFWVATRLDAHVP
jgi:Tol biopolymer transport system component